MSRPAEQEQKGLYYLFYKPYGVLSQFTPDHAGQKTLADFMQLPKGVYPLGRLDKDSEGLIILTNDTRLNRAVLQPGQGNPKAYLARVEGLPTEADIQPMREGMKIRVRKKWQRCLPAKVRLLEDPPSLPERDPPVRFRKTVPDRWLEIELKEGKNRQIRRMCAALGYPVLRLVRTRIGHLELNDMHPGDLRQTGFELFKPFL